MHVLRLQPALLQALRLDAVARCCAASPARSTCRRSASSTRARCRRPTRSRSRSGSRSAGAARWSARIVGAVLVNGAKSWFTVAFPEFWLFFLGLLFIVVTLFLPGGVVGLFRRRGMSEALRTSRRAAPADGARIRDPPRGCGRSTPSHGPILYLDGITVSFDGFRALNDLTPDHRRRRAALHHRPQRRRQDDDDGRHHRQDAARQRHRVLRPDHRPRATDRGRDRAGRASAASSRSRRCSSSTPCSRTSSSR